MPKELPQPLRKLGLSEKYHVSRTLERTYANITLTAELEHPPRPEKSAEQFYLDALYPAVTKLLEIHPRLCTTIAEADQPSAHFIHLPSFDLRDIVQVYEENEQLQIADVIAEECRTKFEFHSLLPLWRLRIHADPQNLRECSITLTMHHALGDGMSVSFFWKELIKHLNHTNPKLNNYLLKRNSKALDAPFEARHPPKMVKRVLAGAVCETISHKLPKPFEKLFKRTWQGDFATKYKFGHTEVRLVQLDSELWQALKSRSKQHGISAHAALHTAMLLAWAELYSGQRVQTSTPVNCRQLCNPPVGQEIGNFVGEHDCVWKPQQFSKGIWSLAKEYYNSLHQHKPSAASKNLLLAYLQEYPRSYEEYWKELRESHELGRSGGLALSDLGRCQMEQEHWKIQGLWFCQSAPTITTALGVNVIETNGCMYATVGWHKGALDENKINMFPGRFVERLKKAINDKD